MVATRVGEQPTALVASANSIELVGNENVGGGTHHFADDSIHRIVRRIDHCEPSLGGDEPELGGDLLHPDVERRHVRIGGGYVVTVDGQKIYFAGGTNFYPAMAQIESDVALYPLSTRADAEGVIGVLPTKVMIPVHISGFAAESHVTLFSQLPTKIKFVVLNEGPYNP